MAISGEIYHAFEEIVGPDNISEEPAILDTYAFQFAAQAFSSDKSRFLPRSDAVLLPGSTEEVQTIIRACNRYHVKHKAYSTGWLFSGSPVVAGTSGPAIQLDLRRMDRILEIDVKNQFAVVEPYVVAAQLQAEAMKVGLNCNMIGAGAGASPLAQSCLGLTGHGPSSIYTGHASEVLLAMEWVTPTGEIIRTGSLGSGCGWFCGEGPGPSLRGIARGWIGTSGAMGVFTKCAVKLSPWPGPPQLPVEGKPPTYRLSLPDNLRAYTIAFPSWEAYVESVYKVWDNEIGYIAHRQYNYAGSDLSAAFHAGINQDPTLGLEHLPELLKRPEIQKLTEELRISYEIVLAGNSDCDIAYQDKVLDRILFQTGGWKVAAMTEPEMMKWSLLYLIRLGHKNLNFAYNGDMMIVFTQYAPPDALIAQAPVLEAALKKHQDTGLLVNSGTDTMMGCMGAMGGGGYVVLEQFSFPDPAEIESGKEGLQFIIDAGVALNHNGFSGGNGIGSYGFRSKEMQEKIYFSSPQPSRFHWQWKIKRMLDPNDVGGAGYCILEKPPG